MSADPAGETASTVVVNALALLPLPSPSGLAPEQVRGATCVFCGITLTGATAVDLGMRSGQFSGVVATWFPRGCKRCVLDTARQTHNEHPRSCEQCVDDPTLCVTRRALRRLVLETRR